MECYWAPLIFMKYYNKWSVAMDERKFELKRDCRTVKVLARMVKRQGAAFEEVKEASGLYGPKSIFCTRTMNEIMGVDSVLVDYYSSM